ncbi:MAG: MiaB/RimO family radical SAM methylthiotransferase [Actinobacteria bacterium]|nr:MiaB/RimO family radical SAM methylthiotransferase [Actinomycetota bacterium]
MTEPETRNSKPETISISVLGCKVNYADTRACAGRLGAGTGPVELVGTCCVTAEGEKQSRKEVRRAVRRAGPAGKVFVTGCAARLAPEEFAALGANVIVIGETDMQAPGVIENGAFNPGRSRSRYFLKVQDGCGGGCSYCIVPLVRGRPRSVPAAGVLREAERRLAEGCRELVITGIDVGAWRDGAARLPRLMERLASVPGLTRLRLSSVEVGHVSDGLLNVIASHNLIGRHLHLPLQSGDDGVLKAMGRHYNRKEFLDRIKEIRAAVPGINLTTDAIVGFPGENSHAFDATLDLVAEAGFSKVHVFTYSPRPGTRAVLLGGQVAPAEKKRRGRRLRELSERQGNQHRQRKVGAIDEILLEREVAPRVWSGYSSDYTRFRVTGGGRRGDLVRVRAEAARNDCVEGQIINETIMEPVHG